MASINGVELKGIKKTVGIEGEGFIANIYLNRKKVGEYADYGDGGMGHYNFDSKEAKQAVIKAAFKYGKTRRNNVLINLYNNRPEQYQNELKRVRTYYPYVPQEDITMNSVAYAGSGIDIFIDDIYAFKGIESYFKKMKKKGHCAVG